MERVLKWLDNNQKALTNGIVTIVTCILVLLLINTQITSKREEQYLQRMREFKKQAESASRHADSLRSEITVHMNNVRTAELKASASAIQARRSRNAVNELLHELDSLREVVTDSVQMARVIIPKQDSIISEQQITISTQDTQITFLNVALSSKDTALTISIQRGDSLQRVVDNIPTPPSPPLFPKITRKQAFIGGVVGGILLKAFVF